MYTIDYYLNKFNAIPEDRWMTGAYTDYDGRCCALGHCGAYKDVCVDRAEVDDLLHLTVNYNTNIPNGTAGICIISVNDGKHSSFKQATPKKRVIAALLHIKARLQEIEITNPPVTIESLISVKTPNQPLSKCIQ